MISANDNRPRHASEFKTSAERMAFLASLPEDDPAPVLAWPSFTRLNRADDKRGLRLLIGWRDLNAPPRLFDVANDNTARASEWTDDFRPSDEELKRLAREMIPLRVSFRRYFNGKTARITHFSILEESETDEGLLRTSNARYYPDETPDDGNGKPLPGRMHSYLTASGKWRKPSERKAKPKGGKQSAKGTGKPILAGGQLAELERRGDVAIIRKALGPLADILDMALTDACAAEIGIAFGGSKGGKSAQRIGVQLIDDALDQFEKIAA